MRNICSKLLTLLSVVSSLGLGISSQAQVVWQVGRNDGAWQTANTGGGADANYAQENGSINPLPGSPISTGANQGADNDYYFAGVYSQTIPSAISYYGAYSPIGVVSANENAAERAFAGGDLDLRYHFNLPSSLRSFDLLSFTWEPLNLDVNPADGTIPAPTDPRYGVEVYFNGVLVQTQIIIRAGQLNVPRTTPQFSLASVNAQVGPGFDNVVSLKGINYNGEGGGNWMGVDFVQLDSAAGASALPNVVNIGQNKVGTVSDNPDSSITIVGGGNDIWSGRDEFTYAYTEVVGDFDVQVRVASLTPNGANSKAGIMARESLSEFSRMAFPRVTPNLAPGTDNARFAYRTGLDANAGSNGGQHEDGTGPSNLSTSNGWLRLSRIGNTLYASNSTDGVSWTSLGSQDTTTWGGGALSNKLFLGLGVCRNGSGPTATAVFRDLQFNSNAAPFTLVAADSRGNPTGVRVSFNNAVGTGSFVPGNYTLGTLSGPNVTAPVTGLRFTTANDADERDPMTFTLEGTVGDAVSGPWTLIASGNTGLLPVLTRNTAGPVVNFANSAAYKSYRLLFPTVRNATTANSMQIAEVEFLDAGGNDVTTVGDPVIPTSANSPAAEQAPLAIDNNSGTKYLNFDKLNTGFTVTPAGAALPSDPTVTAASAGPDSSTVQLTTSGLVEGATYELTVGNVLGADGSALASGTYTFVHGAGYEAYRIRVQHNKTDDGGYYRSSDAVAKGIGDVVKMADTGVFPPVQSHTLLEDPIPDTGSNERFSSRISGLLNITTSGNYTFYMSSDDVGYLYLSTDENPANKVQIANEPAWAGSRQYIVAQDSQQATRGTPPSNISTPKALQAGKKYYIELIFTEGGGGNNASATWLPPGGAPVANGSLPIPESAFAPARQVNGSTFKTLGPVQIVAQPTNQTITALLPVTFVATYDGTAPYTFQWRRNGQPIAGATGPTYTIPAVQLTDDQTSYSVVVANEFSSATSSSALLTVLVPTPPHLVGASSDTSFNTVYVDFDNRLANINATNVANYSITNAGGSVAILSATRDGTARRVILRTATQLAEDTVYTVTVSNLQDETGTTTLEPNPTNTTFTTLAFAAGFIMREFYPQFSGVNVDPFVTAVRAGTVAPTKICLTNTYEYNNGDIGLQGGQADNYGGRMLGYFVPTNSGDHVFYFASDDPGRLFLSTDANPANAVRIAIEPNWADRRAWTGQSGDAAVPRNGTNISVPINLVAGQRYYIESYHTEGGGGDHQAVAVQPPGAPVPANGSSPIPAIQLGTFVQAGNLVINGQPQNQTNTVDGFATFTVDAASSSSICGGGTLNYQWYTNGVAVPGANGASYTTPALVADDNGTVFSVVITAPARTITSSNAVLSVVADETGPSLTSVRVDGSFTNIFLTYNERVNSGSAGEAGNYTIRDSALNQIFVTAVVTNLNGSNVTLITEPMQANTVYNLQVDFQTDLAGNVSIPDPITTNFQTWVVGCPAGGLLWEAFNDIGGTAIIGMTSDPDYPNNPNERRTLPSFDTRAVFATDNLRENFGARVRGLYIPPVSGRYIFYLHSDDAGQLFLNTNGPTEAGKTMIVEELGCCRDWPAVASSPIQLTGGRAYYIEGLYKEAGGGDYIRVAARLEGSTEPLAAISGDQLGGVAPQGAAGNVTITQQPANATVSENTTATFSVAAQPEFAQPVCYQWQRDIGAGFVDIPGATGTNYSFIATLADEGVYRVRVGIIGNAVLSSNAVLDVVNDVTAPTVLSARGVRTLDAIIVRFSERMLAASAAEPGNYTLTDTNGASIALGTPVLSADAMSVTIPTPPQAPGSIYNLAIAAITDQSAAGNQSSPTNFTFQTFIWSRGFATADYFFGIGGVLVSDLTNNAAYPNSPSMTEYVSLLEQRNNFGAGVNAMENYGSHLYGQLIAPRTANYNFYVTSDDGSSLYLSTDATPANNVLIASEPGWNGEREFINGANQVSRGTPPANRSTTLFPGGIALTASNLYYVELIAKEGGGGDNSSVAFEYPGSPRVVNGSLPIHGTHLQTLADPNGASITIVEQTTFKILTSTNVQHGTRALISVTAVGTNVNGNAPVVYQWQRSDNGGPWYDLNGANGNTFLAPVAAGKVADYRALIFIPGAQATSAPVHLVGEMVLRWTDPGVLQQAPTVTGPWTDIVPAAVSPYLIDTTDPAHQPMRFFRLRPAP